MIHEGFPLTYSEGKTSAWWNTAVVENYTLQTSSDSCSATLHALI